MDWTEVRVVTDGEGAEAVAEALRPFAYNQGVALEQLGDMSTADPDALETAVTVKIYLPEDKDTPHIRQQIETIIYHLGRLYPLPEPTFHRLAEQDWANAWKAHYHPFRVGERLWIQPSWVDELDDESGDKVQPGDLVLTLDPGMAFGTGSHPTTQMCLRFLEKYLEPGQSVMDVGTGSGILAIAAAKLGASEVFAFDNDDLAVKTAVSNVEQNSVTGLIQLEVGTLETVPFRQWDVVVVNILAQVINYLIAEENLLGHVNPAGVILLSGIIEEQLPEVVGTIEQAGGRVQEVLQIRDWVCLAVQTAK